MLEIFAIIVLLVLCVFFSVATLKEQPPEGPTAAANVVSAIQGTTATSDVILVVSSAEPVVKL